MKKTILKRIASIPIAIVFMLSLYTLPTAKLNAAFAASYVVPAVSYETDDDYDYTKTGPIETMTFGKKALGTLTVSGDINDETNYKDSNGKSFKAFGLNSGQLSFSYDYNGYLLEEDVEEDSHYIEDDNRFFGDDIGKGLLNVYKSYNGTDWENAINPVIDLFGESKSSLINFYTTSGEELAKGSFYRITISYMTAQNVSGIDPSTYHVEVYEFFACKNSGTIALHEIGADASQYKSEEYSIEIFSRSETILDGGTTLKGFSIDTLGAAYEITVNGSIAQDGAEYTKEGKYTVKAKTKLGKEKTTTVYVFKGGSDKGKSIYFDDLLVAEKRIFRDGYNIPVYAKNSIAKIKAISDSIPPMTGTIRNNDTGEVITLDVNNRNEQTYTLSPGTYSAVLFSGKPLSGSVYRYKFSFAVLEEEARPYVNRSMISELKRAPTDLKAQHYEVAYETTRGGIIYVCFNTYEEAFKYAYQIEKRYIEHNDDGLYYLKDKNSNKDKMKYPTKTKEDKLKLTKLINENAEKNIEIAFFDASEIFSYQTFDDKKSSGEALEDQSLAKSVRVFPSEEELQMLLDNDIPLINGYTFSSVGSYDVESVKAIDETTGEEYDLNFTQKVDDQLTKSSKYKIIETSKYGDNTEYEVLFLADYQTTLSASINANENTTKTEISNSQHNDITADSVSFDGAVDLLDDSAIVKIQPDNELTYPLVCNVSRINGLTLYEAGNYTITFVDRAKNTFSFNVYISGTMTRKDVITGNAKTYRQIYNTIHLNHSIPED